MQKFSIIFSFYCRLIYRYFQCFFQDKVKKRNQHSETENLKMLFSDKALQTDSHKTEEMFPTHDFNQERISEYETKCK